MTEKSLIKIFEELLKFDNFRMIIKILREKTAEQVCFFCNNKHMYKKLSVPFQRNAFQLNGFKLHLKECEFSLPSYLFNAFASKKANVYLKLAWGTDINPTWKLCLCKHVDAIQFAQQFFSSEEAAVISRITLLLHNTRTYDFISVLPINLLLLGGAIISSKTPA